MNRRTEPEFKLVQDDEYNPARWYLVCTEAKYEHTHKHGGHAFPIHGSMMTPLIDALIAARLEDLKLRKEGT